MSGPNAWDLGVLYPDDRTATDDAARLAKAAGELAAGAEDTLRNGELSSLVAELAELEAAIDHVHDYARMRQYSDANGPGVQETMIAIVASVTSARGALERVLDAWREIPADAADGMLGEPSVEPAAYRLRQARRLAHHRLSPEAEQVWAARTESARTRWGSLNDNVEGALAVSFDDGTGARLWGVGDLGTVVRRPELGVRRAAYAALAGAYESINDVLAIAWDALVADRLAEDRLRGRDHPAQETLDDEDMPLAGLLSLVEVAPTRYDVRQRLLERQAEILGLDEFQVADADASLPGLEGLGYTEVVDLAVAGLGSLAPQLGEDALALARLGRIDGETRAGKQPYAVTFSTRLDPPAFLSFRYSGAPANVPLLGHELGHAVAFARSAAAQPPIGHGLPGVVFEVPSLTAEIAAGDAFVAAHPEHAQVIGFAAAQDLAWSAFEAVAFCVVELDLYATRADGTILTADVIRGAFKRRFSELYGPGVAFDDRDALVAMGGWANYAMHSRFYNFQYAVGALVALALHARRREDPERFAEDYVAFLSEGRRSSPAAQLERFGLVLGERSLWEAGYDELERRFSAV